jgi:hypothetical protein
MKATALLEQAVLQVWQGGRKQEGRCQSVFDIEEGNVKY